MEVKHYATCGVPLISPRLHQRGSSEENEMANKAFKTLYTARNNSIDSLAQKLLISCVSHTISLLISQTHMPVTFTYELSRC